MRFSQFIRFQIAVWTVYAAFIFPAKLAVEESLTGALGSFVVHDGISIVLTFGMAATYDRVYRKHEELLWLGGAIAFLCISAGFLQVISYWLIGDIFPSEHRTIFGDSVAVGIFYFRFGVFTCWSLLYLVIKHQREDAERELHMLRAQMNPHLLSNALEHVIAELEPIHAKAAGMVQSLMNYFNYSLRHQKDDFVTMAEEYDALEDYLKLEEARWGRRLDIGCQVEPATRNIKVPGIILQPLMENAVKYGLQTTHDAVFIRIEASREDSSLVIQVHNTGRWIEPDPNRSMGGIGLDNLHRRLWRLYGRKHKIETFEEEGWVTVRVTIPVKP